MSNLQLNNSIHFTRPGNRRESLKLNKAYYYSKVKAILSETYKFSLLHNGANQHSWLWNYYMLSTELPKNSFTNKLFLTINRIQFTTLDQNNLIIMYGLPNVHKQNSPRVHFPENSLMQPRQKFWLNFLTLSLSRNQSRVNQILFLSSYCNSLSNSNNPSTLVNLV